MSLWGTKLFSPKPRIWSFHGPCCFAEESYYKCTAIVLVIKPFVILEDVSDNLLRQFFPPKMLGHFKTCLQVRPGPYYYYQLIHCFCLSKPMYSDQWWPILWSILAFKLFYNSSVLYIVKILLVIKMYKKQASKFFTSK